MQLAREPITFPGRRSRRPSDVEGTARGPLLSLGVKPRQVELACGDPLSEGRDEAVDCHFNSLTNTGNESSTKRTATLCVSSTIRKSAEYGPGLMKYAGRLDKASMLAQMVSNPKRCSVCTKSLETLVGMNLSKKYITSRDSYNLKVVNDIIYNENSHIVTVFKEFLIYDDVSEFLRRFYTAAEAPQRLKKVNDYYAKYSKVFPNYFLFQESKYMFKNIKRKQKCIDDQQRALASAKERTEAELDDEDRLFTTHCMQEIDRPDSILGRSQRDPKDQTLMQSYMRSQESIKNCAPKSVAVPSNKRVEDMNLQELVDGFILKDSISVINVSSLGADGKRPPTDEMKPKITHKYAQTNCNVSKKEGSCSNSRPTSRPRNLRLDPPLPSGEPKEAWAEPAIPKESLAHHAYPTRAASVALLNAPKQAARMKDPVEKPASTRSRSHDKYAAGTGRATLGSGGAKPVPLNSGSSTKGASRPHSSMGTVTAKSAKPATHSRNPHLEKQGTKSCATNLPYGRTVGRPVEGLATARSSSASHHEGMARAKTTSQTPRTSLERKSVAPSSTTHGKRQSSVAARTKSPTTTIQRAINCFLGKDGAPLQLALHSTHDSRPGANSKPRNLKGVAIDLESTNKQLQRRIAAGPATQHAAASGQTPGHTRRYKSDYLNSLTNNQNVPTSLLHHGKPSGTKAELKTPPELMSRLMQNGLTGAALRADTVMGSYTTSHSMAKGAMTARDSRLGYKSAAKVQASRARVSRVPCV